jgi:hypothetical protein
MEKSCTKCNITKPSSDYREGRNTCKSCENKIRYQQKKERRSIDSEYDKKLKAYDVKRKRRNEKNNPMAGFIQKMRQSIRRSLKRKGYTKNSNTCKILGISWEEFKPYFESLFQEGMTWDNYGEWEIDHIVPISSGKTEEDVIKLCHYKNLQPLWKEDNRKKGNKLPDKTPSN